MLDLKIEVTTCFEMLVSVYENTWLHILDDKNYNSFILKTQSNGRVKEIVGVCGTLILYMVKADGA